jgi:lactoylglutathione lyase
MRIEHIALWTGELEKSRAFYEKYFGAHSGDKYVNKAKGFSSYFLSFDSGCRLEIMQMSNNDVCGNFENKSLSGISHFAVSVGSKEKVEELTNRLRIDNFEIVSEPRKTGDGYYESAVLDPDGNKVEITI